MYQTLKNTGLELGKGINEYNLLYPLHQINQTSVFEGKDFDLCSCTMPVLTYRSVIRTENLVNFKSVDSTSGPQITSFQLTSFCYSINEIPQEPNSCFYQLW